MHTREMLESAMRRALAIARRGPEHDANPQVGCVLIDSEGRIIAESWHRGAGTAHAEVDALSRLPQDWRSRMSELTAVITLEPCNHTGRTGPCSVALVESGISTVVFALKDPGEISGGGSQVLRDAGVNVTSGVLAYEARALLAPWLAERHPEVDAGARGGNDGVGTNSSFGSSADSNADSNSSDVSMAHGQRPRVTVKWAQTIDGRAAASDGSSQWITGPEARADVHLQRAQADAILVGTGTLLVDDPALTARDAAGELLVQATEQPIPIVLGHRDIPQNARVMQHPALSARGLDSPITLSGDDLASDLASLHAQGIRHLFVEGGPTVASAFITAGLADELLIYLAPALLGGPLLALGELGITSMPEILRLEVADITAFGNDFRLTATVQDRQDSAAPTYDAAQNSTHPIPQHTEEQH